MSFYDFITNSGKNICKDNFINLVQIARVDGNISDKQMKILHKEGRKFGLTEPEIDSLIVTEGIHSYNPPYSLRGKFVHLYNTAEIILDDEVVTEDEKKLVRKFAVEAGFRDEILDELMEFLFDGIQKEEPEENLFREFKKKFF